MEILTSFSNSKYTAKKRKKVSFPTKYLFNKNKICGKVLDFGCGYGKDVEFLESKQVNVVGYDLYYKPEHPKGKFDTIICNYVLNVVLYEEMLNIIMIISELLNSNGKAYFSVRRDLEKEGFREHYVAKEITYQKNVILPFRSILRNNFCEIYQLDNLNLNLDKTFPILVTNSINFYAVADERKNSRQNYKIIAKKPNENFLELSYKKRTEIWQIINRLIKIVNYKYYPIDCSIKINSDTESYIAHILFRFKNE